MMMHFSVLENKNKTHPKPVRSGQRSWRDGPVVKTIYVSIMRTRVRIQACTLVSSWMPITPAPRSLMPSLSLCTHMCTYYHICTYINKITYFLKNIRVKSIEWKQKEHTKNQQNTKLVLHNTDKSIVKTNWKKKIQINKIKDSGITTNQWNSEGCEGMLWKLIFQ